MTGIDIGVVAVLTEAAVQGFSWWMLVPTLVPGSVAVAAAPIWPWSRQWGWAVAAIFGSTAATAALFTLAWWFS